jgi:heme/copper-type cytochrome/quinol oxidase subunit 2
MKPVHRFGLVGLMVVVAAAAFFIARPSSNQTPPPAPAPAPNTAASAPPASSPVIKQIRVQGGQPVGGINDITVKKNQPVRFAVSSDSAQDIHVHGYDLRKTVPAGGRVEFDFPATIDGSFVIELERSSTQIASLKVMP